VTYYVHKNVPDGRRAKWEVSSEHEAYPDAQAAARALCPKGQPIETEPGRGMVGNDFDEEGVVMRLERTSKMMHGVEQREGDGLLWMQYWRGVDHVWHWHGVPVWWRLRKRDRPMHELINQAVGN
jgi:hypothetical protein